MCKAETAALKRALSAAGARRLRCAQACHALTFNSDHQSRGRLLSGGEVFASLANRLDDRSSDAIAAMTHGLAISQPAGSGAGVVAATCEPIVVTRRVAKHSDATPALAYSARALHACTLHAI